LRPLCLGSRASSWLATLQPLFLGRKPKARVATLYTCYNLKPAKTGKAATAAAIVNHLMVPRADVVTKHDVHNAIEVIMEQVAENILAPTMEAKIVSVIG
jgi:hypothetical protein